MDMEHVVFYPGPDAMSGFRRFPSLEEAVHFVEHLRNVEGLEDVSVHALTPVPLAFRAYYKVEMPAAVAAPVAEVPAQAVDEMPAMPEVSSEVPVEAPAEPVAAGSHGKRSLGFFAS